MTASLATKPALLRDRFSIPQKDVRWEFSESQGDSKVDGETVLARVVGPFFTVGGVSLNNRRYTPELWETCIANCKERLEHGGLFGTVGHEQPLDEAAVRAGNLSHTVTNLWIKDGIGMGELLVLGTEAGKQLNVYLRAGMPLAVSSRAYGQISGQDADGSDVIDADTFFLETFDFVLNPGVDTAYPRVVENLPEQINEELDMSKELLEALITEKGQLQAQLTEVLTENKALTEAAKTIDNYKKAVDFYRKNFGKIAEAREVLEGLRKFLQLDRYKNLVQEKDYLDRPTGEPTLQRATKSLTEMVEKCLAEGTPAEHKAAKEALAKIEELGTVEQLTSVITLFEQYAEIGPVKEIKSRLARARKVEIALTEARKRGAARKIASKFAVNEKVVTEFLKTMSPKAVVEQLKALKENNKIEENYKVSGKAEAPAKSTVVKFPAAKARGVAESMFEEWNRHADQLTAESIAKQSAYNGRR